MASSGWKKLSWVLFFAGAVAVLFSGVRIFMFTPEDLNQGITQKVFYIHFAFALNMYLSVFVGMVAAACYLATKDMVYDLISASAIDVGLLFITGVLISGSLWAKPIWGTYWTWDPRLTTTFLIFLVYAAYAIIRGQLPDNPDKQTILATIAVFGSLLVPVIHFSVKFLRGVHPQVISQGSMPTSMWVSAIATLIAFTLVNGALMINLSRQRLLEKKFAKNGGLHA